MPFPALTALGFIAKEDSAAFDHQMVDPAIKKEIEGGFVISRRRFTRTVWIYSTGFTDITQADKLLWDQFLASVGGGSASFMYTDPTTSASMAVRFKEIPVAKYAGLGTNFRWDIKPIKLETV
jgi:hypothetical protein